MPKGELNPEELGRAGQGAQFAAVSGIAEPDTIQFGVYGSSANNAGVKGESKKDNGVFGRTDSPTASGVYGQNDGGGFGIAGRSKQDQGVGVYGEGGRLAGLFAGDVEVTGDIRVTGDIKLTNADCAEDFDVFGVEPIEPGTVMVVGEAGALRPSHQAYDKCVAGVISGAGSFKPGIVLDKQNSQNNRMPIALLGKVYCKVDAHYSPIEIGDLLTTSPTLGCAMKADDPFKAFGSVIGKALHPLREGQGLIPILIALQ